MTDRLRALAREAHKPQARKLRDRATMNILTVTDPAPEVVKPIVRQLLSALEEAERYIDAQRQDLLSRTDPPVSEGRTEPQPDEVIHVQRRVSTDEFMLLDRTLTRAQALRIARDILELVPPNGQLGLLDAAMSVADDFQGYGGFSPTYRIEVDRLHRLVEALRALGDPERGLASVSEGTPQEPNPSRG